MRVRNMNSKARLSRPALGEHVSLGTFYDARTDNFLPQSLLRKDAQIFKESASAPRDQPPEVKVIFNDSYFSQFDLMDIGPDLGASILAKLIKPRGACAYLDAPKQGEDILYAAIHHKVVSSRENFNVLHPRNESVVEWEALRNSSATHFVVGIEWGIQSVVSIKHAAGSLEACKAVEDQFKNEISEFQSAVETDFSTAPENPHHNSKDMPLEVATYCDIPTEFGVFGDSLDNARSHMNLVRTHIETEYFNLGRPMMYKLLPIHVLGVLMGTEDIVGAAMSDVNSETEKRLIQLFDQFFQCHKKLRDDYDYISQHEKYCSERFRREANSKIWKLQSNMKDFEQQYTDALVKVRGGVEEESVLEHLYNTYVNSEASPTTLVSTADLQITKIKFILDVTQLGAVYISSGDRITHPTPAKKTYVFLINDVALKDSKSWNANTALFRYLLDGQKFDADYIIWDDHAVENVSACVYISCYEKGELVSGDVLEEQNWLAKQCFVQYDADTLESQAMQRPLKRRLITMPCPSRNCSRSRICEWKCSKCRTQVEFGFTDKYIYCHCGRSLYKNFSFKCDHSSHGGVYEKCQSQHVLGQLRNLGDSENVNILVLGETGVGKSTFINAFVNYLTFNSLDEAKAEEELNWVIPCSFSTQKMDRSRSDGVIEQIKIKVGTSEGEHDGSEGASATQRTMVYPVTIGNRTIRLIDTPGIGDTRGIQYDKKNMADILTTLSSYDDLHGILILVKSNNARLTVTFNFCMKELLTHLHRSAANNMAFGFTNTRISNYTPGDTFGPLSTLIQNHSDIGLSLTTHTTYCFDSESFRYLAAFKNGVVMENEEDFRRSWKHSRMESLRLIEYFKSKKPHKVQNTISINGARQLIASLTKPMAEISALIKANIAMSEDRVKEMADTRVTGEKLKERLHIQKMHLRTKPLEMPRTVCADKDCIELRDDGGGVVVTVYKTHCHAECYLDNVQVDQVAHSGLIGCAAFGGSNYCNRCSHHWQSHLHVLFELEEYLATVTDTEVERQIQANANDVILREAAIQALNNLIAEYKEEHSTIQKASARFGVFLKKYSITPYNDATLEYLDMLIRDEEMKVHVGGNRKRLDGLLEDRRQHEELVDSLTRNMDNKYELQYQVLNEAGVENLVSQLYALPHFGENLQAVKNTISTAHEATNREHPIHVNRGWYSASKNVYKATVERFVRGIGGAFHLCHSRNFNRYLPQRVYFYNG
ncbi:uncharacterized protein F4812DRAFT_113863 [Daldinia caldariorum]|uniref:uncharacterized protein n=1 Tax=Daldinia caldariorum TaxID=326644 RepID=UPI0020073A69|nr:uncharacterized protein F4812DRAFT_113863 [Daldinia caldariorum]KAI1465830.1 hypothetical protein F4812DRAFT_113863 [Daldinia caldariorum]